MAEPVEQALSIHGLEKAFNGKPALQGIDLDVPRGEVLALLGASGCGKTTLLRCIAGLETPDAGHIDVAGARVWGGRKPLPPEARSLGMVFQDYALWPHMSVAENVGFPLEMAGVARRVRRERVEEALETVGLEAMADRSPGTLSGGQQQRVALARAIVTEPRLLLMDEPLSNLDKNLRESLALDIRHLIERLNLTAVFVTHDQHEAFALADRIAVMQSGRFAQVDDPQALYLAPANPEIARFLDAGVLIEGRLSSEGLMIGANQIAASPSVDQPGPMTVMIPRQALTLVPMAEADAIARVESRVFQGEQLTLRLRLCPEVTLKMDSNQRLAVGDTVGVRFDRNRILGWDSRGRRVTPLGDFSDIQGRLHQATLAAGEMPSVLDEHQWQRLAGS